MTWMVIRLVLSLAFIAGVLWFAARLAKKRGLGQAGGLIEVVARQRMGRASSVNVIRVADRVLVVGATEEQVTLLTEVDGEVVEAILEEHRAAARTPRTTDGTPGGPLSGSVFDRSGWMALLGELRDRTVRR
jgi:flagellar protein FliO/FliZ